MEWLKAIREKHGYSQTQIAETIKITQPAYCNIENGERRPSVETAKKIAQALGFEWTRFFEINKEIS